MKIINNLFFILIFLQLFFSQFAYANSLESDLFQIYFSKSFSYSKTTPSIVAGNSTNTIKWFDDFPSMSVDQRNEIGLINNSSGYSFSLREQTVHGNHSGTTAKYICLGFFCSWVDYSLIGSLDSNDLITYDIQFLQLSGKKVFKNDAVEFSPLVGINFISYDLIISNSTNKVNDSGLLPLPFVGLNFKLLLPKKFEIIYDTHYSNIFYNNSYLKFVDSELELRYKLSKFIQIGIGKSKLFLNLHHSSGSLESDLLIPVQSSFIKLIFIY
jgi:hypothetical protein